MMEDNKENKQYILIYWFIVGLTVFGMILSLATIFIPIEKENQRFADTAMIFWLSTAVSGGIGYLIGSSASKTNKSTTPTGETSAYINAEITQKNKE
jgi:hypothetical protein